MQKSSATIVPVDGDSASRIESNNVDSMDAKGSCGGDTNAPRDEEREVRSETEKDEGISDKMIDSAQKKMGRKIVFKDEVSPDVDLHRVSSSLVEWS